MLPRELPASDRFASCPGDEKILAYYAGTFDSVYVSLSPFFRPITLSTDVFKPDTYPARHEITRSCTPVPWREVMTATGLPSLSAVDIGLRTRISGLKECYANREFANRIDALFDASGIVSPEEGQHSDLLHNQVLGLFQELGHSWVWVGDEFCTERKLHWIEDLLTEKEPTICGHCNVFSPDKSLLWTVHWDSHFSLICSSRENLDRIDIAGKLEGFYCTPDTEMYWSVHGI